MLRAREWTSISSLQRTPEKLKLSVSGVKLHRNVWNMLDVLRMQSVSQAESMGVKAVKNAESPGSTHVKSPGHKHPSGLAWSHPSFDPDIVRLQSLDGLEAYSEDRGGFTRPREADDAPTTL
jgi:hypothetical protein